MVVRKADNAIYRINHYPADGVNCFVNTHPEDGDLSGGQRYPPFENPETGVFQSRCSAIWQSLNQRVCFTKAKFGLEKKH